MERLLKLLNNPAGNPSMVRRYVQEQAITTLAMVADASEVTFGKVRLSKLFSLRKILTFLLVVLLFYYAIASECAVDERCGWARFQKFKGEGDGMRRTYR